MTTFSEVKKFLDYNMRPIEGILKDLEEIIWVARTNRENPIPIYSTKNKPR